MQWDTMTLVLFIAAAGASILAVIVAAYSYFRPKSKEPIQDQQDGWTPTGRIDFTDPQSSGTFILQVEDTRIVESIGGVEHRDFRWRRATIEEAKMVVLAYHSQRNLTMTANFVVSATRQGSDQQTESQGAQRGRDDASGDGKAEG